MKTTIVFKATDEKPEETLIFDDAAPSFNFEDDEVSLMDYDHILVSEAFLLKSVKSIAWDEFDEDRHT